jgi:glycine/D-amino acid oxidase-like deaminating enzyme
MDLMSGYPFWPIKNGLIASYPTLKQDLACDVAVIGGGITGALIAYYLTETGCDTVLVDRRDIGGGSTSASTALLQYEVDTPLFRLIDLVGREHAVRSYLLCLEAIGKLGRLIENLDDDCGFEHKHSLYLASRRRHVGDLRKEYAARRACGIRLDLLDQADIAARYSFRYPAALLSYDAAQVDAYRLTHALLRAAARRGLRIYDRTLVTDCAHTAAGVQLTTERGCRIAARKVAVAAGFEAQQYLRRKVATFKSTYALISEPLEHFAGWPDQCLIWESARPYVYLRTTSDGRAIIGGEDDLFDSEARRERRLERKRDKLVKRFRAMFPEIDLDVAYYWAGTFGETADGLAYIGETSEFPNGYFALGYGGNGITYSLIAAEIIRDIYTGRPNRDAAIFRFDR